MIPGISSPNGSFPPVAKNAAANARNEEGWPHDEVVAGLPDPAKYLDWRRGPNPGPLLAPMVPGKDVCGGLDSPMFYHGKVITRREFQRLQQHRQA